MKGYGCMGAVLRGRGEGEGLRLCCCEIGFWSWSMRWLGSLGLHVVCAIGMAYINVTQTSEELGWAVMASWVSVSGRRDMSQGTVLYMSPRW